MQAHYCKCGGTELVINGLPLFRIICHCSICQRFSGSPFADVVVYRGRDVHKPFARAVIYQTFRRFLSTKRGKCSRCGAPVLEMFHSFWLPSLVMVPINMFREHGPPLAPVGHMFYDKCVTEVTDDLPKYQGYWRSQLGFGRFLLPALLRREPRLAKNKSRH